FPKEIHEKLAELIHLPNGLILVTGPTGSGKTTTLYSLLSTIIGTKRNIITLEDPIEYEISGIVQSEVDPDHDYTFATGLRSILRHDPNVILVGEIRDLETAQTAIDAALTGHIVLATLHTNSAVEAIPRLLSMGVSPYTFAPSLRGILAQRLVRTLTEAYRTEATPYDPMNPDIYGGRCVVPELFVVSPRIREMILTQELASTLLEQATKEGYRTMRQWGESMVTTRITTREELERVTM
ncbi:Flp pilus assembly complex ATPase component TadA, partial [Candidatus Peregrinibacteria bacterium]|nr:Flp pilus assembly complex ATPase component TadA [Candidatus Peregrinibacteria bacterium]